MKKIIPVLLSILLLCAMLTSCAWKEDAQALRETAANGFFPKEEAAFLWGTQKGVSIPTTCVWQVTTQNNSVAFGLAPNDKLILGFTENSDTVYYDVTCVSIDLFKQYVNKVYDTQYGKAMELLNGITWKEENLVDNDKVVIYGENGDRYARLYMSGTDAYRVDYGHDNTADGSYFFAKGEGSGYQFSPEEENLRQLDAIEDLITILEHFDTETKNDLMFDVLLELINK